MIAYVWIAAALFALGLYLRQVYSRFSSLGVRQPTPLPLLGNMAAVMFRKVHFAEHLEEVYKAFPGERFVGKYEFLKPLVLIRDLELVKKITIKDFEHFLDHREVVDQESEPLFGRNLFSLKGQEWKDMRSTLSPAFTSSKIRLMVPFMVEVGEQMMRVLRKKIEDSGVDYIDVEAKDLTSRYANDVIATCAFGLKVDSHTDEQNEFYFMGRSATAVTLSLILKVIAFGSFPKLMTKLNFKLMPEKTRNFFKNLFLGAMRDREERHIIRPDMIHLLMEAKKGKLSHDENIVADDGDVGFATVQESAIGKKKVNRDLTDDDLVAQAVLFFLAGFDTISSGVSFLLHEVAVNPDVQEKLVQEIVELDSMNGGEFSYDSIQRLPYLDMVVSEVLRMWPPVQGLDRRCSKDYNLGRPNSSATEDYIIRKDEGIQIPVWGFHRNPEYFANPQKFDPERFSEQNRHKIKPFSYIPFGVGPRNCIGTRFALCEMKVMTYQLLKTMEVAPCEKTQIPAQVSRESVNLQIKGGHWVRMRVRR